MAENQVLLGIDTGGTYTDAVLFSDEKGVMAKAKSLTTKHDLAIGISGAVDAVLKEYQGATTDIALTSISTTLATNALVEGKGGSIALIMIGFDEKDMEKAGLAEALAGDPVIFIPGGHDVSGNERKLDMSLLEDFISSHKSTISGFAVAGYFAVRNPSHELKVRDVLREKTGMAVTCSHELSSKLGGPKRALTTVLNARLIPVIQDLILACRSHLEKTGITSPLMVVRGDGALVDAEFALKKPIETILSGPAASLVGAKFLLGTKDAIVSDIGGTTTDVAILEKGWPRIEPNGASVGGYTTMVEAVAMHTFGLGGDSVVEIDDTTKTKVRLGPRRQIPLSLLAMDYEAIVIEALRRQEQMEYPNHMCARFAYLVAGAKQRAGQLKATELKLFEKLTDKPQPLDQLLKGASESGTLEKLVSRGLAQVSGFTPSDAMHVLNIQNNWNASAARLGADILCRVRDRFAQAVATSAEEFCFNIKRQLTSQSADVILKTCMDEDGITLGAGAFDLIERGLEKQDGLINLSISLDRVLVGLGASANVYYPDIGKRLSSECHVPEHADVANAIGAVAGEVRVHKTVTITSEDGGSSFQFMSGEVLEHMVDEKAAIEKVQSDLKKELAVLAQEAGAQSPVFETDLSVHAPEINGTRHFVEAVVFMSATGRPRFD
jgi:N-methylhydantoinase A/oxoprolinase/acetone carboxylase beta subunit